MPLPPYIQYSEDKESVYQPIFAKNSGSVASPTASLHFTDELLQAITEKGFLQETLTLHVGLGTFKNIYEQDIRDFEMHSESAEVSKDIFEKIASYKKDGKIVLAIGTTVTRTLETLPVLWTLISGKFSWTDECKSFWDTIQKSDKNIIPSFSIDGETIRFQSKIFIYPGFDFVVIDELITNFHLPKSTLLMLVSAFL
jgi:S-adenosylmethionine:tRNA ribosyltransferase-isomerase